VLQKGGFGGRKHLFSTNREAEMGPPGPDVMGLAGVDTWEKRPDFAHQPGSGGGQQDISLFTSAGPWSWMQPGRGDSPGPGLLCLQHVG
jgi:hypothetical protein